MKSFGIINVSVKPSDAAITLGSGTYGNNEKRMTNYGTYILMIDHDGYISSKNTFIIDKEIPYYIDSLILVPTPTYTRIGTGMDHIANIRDNEWIAHTASGMILMNEALSSGTYVSS